MESEEIYRAAFDRMVERGNRYQSTTFTVGLVIGLVIGASFAMLIGSHSPIGESHEAEKRQESQLRPD